MESFQKFEKRVNASTPTFSFARVSTETLVRGQSVWLNTDLRNGQGKSVVIQFSQAEFKLVELSARGAPSRKDTARMLGKSPCTILCQESMIQQKVSEAVGREIPNGLSVIMAAGRLCARTR